MHNYIFAAATNGLLLQTEEINPVACKQPRPVYAEEMDLLGFGRVIDYPRYTVLPQMWREQTSYFYKGVKIAKLKSSEFVEMPEIGRASCRERV